MTLELYGIFFSVTFIESSGIQPPRPLTFSARVGAPFAIENPSFVALDMMVFGKKNARGWQDYQLTIGFSCIQYPPKTKRWEFPLLENTPN